LPSYSSRSLGPLGGQRQIRATAQARTKRAEPAEEKPAEAKVTRPACAGRRQAARTSEAEPRRKEACRSEGHPDRHALPGADKRKPPKPRPSPVAGRAAGAGRRPGGRRSAVLAQSGPGRLPGGRPPDGAPRRGAAGQATSSAWPTKADHRPA
jgi:hypothetical protein